MTSANEPLDRYLTVEFGGPDPATEAEARRRLSGPRLAVATAAWQGGQIRLLDAAPGLRAEVLLPLLVPSDGAKGRP